MAGARSLSSWWCLAAHRGSATTGPHRCHPALKSPSEKSRKRENPRVRRRKSRGDRQSSGSQAWDSLPWLLHPMRCKQSPHVPGTLQTVSQGPLLLQLWKGKSSRSKGSRVWNGCDRGQCPLGVWITVGETPVIRAHGDPLGKSWRLKPAQREASGTQGALSPPAEEVALGTHGVLGP